MLITSDHIFDPQVFNGLVSISAIIDCLINGDKTAALKKNNQDTYLNGIDKYFIMAINPSHLNDKISLDTMSLSTKLEKCLEYSDIPIKSRITLKILITLII